MELRSVLDRVRFHGGQVAAAARVAVAGPLMLPFSRLWRHRLEATRLLAAHPFLDVETDLSEFLDRDLDGVALGPVAAGHANVSAFELLSLCSLVAQCRCRHVFEIGTFDGRTTLAMARNVPTDGHVYTLNLPPADPASRPAVPTYDATLSTMVVSGERFIGTPESARITQLWGDSAAFDYAPYRGRMDFVFVDGAHSEAYVANDTARALELLRPEGGMIAWHDATRYGVRPFLTRYRRETGLPLRVVASTALAVAARRQGRFVDPVAYARSIRRGGG
jgi:hypothetical protein